MSIYGNYQEIRESVPDGVTIVVACKGRSPAEVREVIRAGATDIGENYVREAEMRHGALGQDAGQVRWHMIGHLQKNKINKAIPIFDVIQSVDSLETAEALDKRLQAAGKRPVPVYIEINIGSEFTKSGVKPEYREVEDLARGIAGLKHLRLEGLMTMGPRFGYPEGSRPSFRKTREIFERIGVLNLPGTVMKTLSMGMSNAYKVAVEEGSNMIRIGSAIFGERE